MRTPSLYPEIRADLRIIAREAITEGDEYVDSVWREIRRQIAALAEQAQLQAKERKARDREERRSAKTVQQLNPEP